MQSGCAPRGFPPQRQVSHTSAVSTLVLLTLVTGRRVVGAARRGRRQARELRRQGHGACRGKGRRDESHNNVKTTQTRSTPLNSPAPGLIVLYW